MLEMRRQCERCGRGLAPEDLASICSFECTFCRDCAEQHLACACPNCGGELVARPRPATGYVWAWESPGPARAVIGWVSATTGSVRAFARRARNTP